MSRRSFFAKPDHVAAKLFREAGSGLFTTFSVAKTAFNLLEAIELYQYLFTSGGVEDHGKNARA